MTERLGVSEVAQDVGKFLATYGGAEELPEFTHYVWSQFRDDAEEYRQACHFGREWNNYKRQGSNI